MKKIGTLKDVYNAFIEYVKKMQGKKGRYVLYIVKRELKRTIPQNAFFHVLFEIIREQEELLGNKYSFRQIKHIMKCSLLGFKEIELDGFILLDPLKGTSELTEQEGIDFIEQMIEWCNTRYGLNFISKDDERLLDYYNNYFGTGEKNF